VKATLAEASRSLSAIAELFVFQFLILMLPATVHELNVAVTIRRGSCRIASVTCRGISATCATDLVAMLAGSPNFAIKVRRDVVNDTVCGK